MSMVSVHIPTEDKLEEEKDADVSIVLGDWNTKIWKESSFRPIIGAHSMHHPSCNNCVCLINFAASRGIYHVLVDSRRYILAGQTSKTYTIIVVYVVNRTTFQLKLSTKRK